MIKEIIKPIIDYITFEWLFPLAKYGWIITIVIAIYLIARNLIHITIYV